MLVNGGTVSRISYARLSVEASYQLHVTTVLIAEQERQYRWAGC
jgi:hypothetical protein